MKASIKNRTYHREGRVDALSLLEKHVKSMLEDYRTKSTTSQCTLLEIFAALAYEKPT